MAHDVFISHSAKDKTTADAVCAMLESNGVRCWIAPRDVTPGMEWGQCIIESIEQSRIMILVFTAHANESSQIRREIERAVNHGVAILPVRIEDVLPGKALEFFIGNVHWLDALTPPLEIHLKNLAGTVKMLLGRMEPRDAGPIPRAADAVSKLDVSELVPLPKAATIPESTTSPSKGPAKSPPVAAVNPPETISDKHATVTPQTFEPQRPIFSGADAGEAKKPVKRRWLRGVVIGVSALIVVLVALAFLIPSGTRRVVHNPGRLELALVADFAPNQTGAPLLNYRNTGKVYGIERDLTLPGDIDSVEETRDANGIPALEIRLTDAAVKRMNSGASIVDHDMALVLDGRTIIAIARVRDPLGNALIMSGNFSADDLNRLLDAIASSPQQKSENGRIPDSNSSGGTAPAPRGDQTVTTQSENVKSTPPEVREDHPPTARKNVVPKRVQQDESVAISSVIKQVQPIYPALALESHIEGQVRLNTIIDVDARVIEVKYLSGPAMLVPSAMDAVKKCRFKPTMLNGAPVQVESVIEVNFKLGG